MEKNEDFSFTYSAQQQKEVAAIRSKYLPKEDDKLEQLRKLHSIPTHKAQSASIAVGVIGALILGTGMSLCMTDLGNVWGNMAMVIGILIGLVGAVLIALAYPVYNRTLQRERERIGPAILKLTDELMK